MFSLFYYSMLLHGVSSRFLYVPLIRPVCSGSLHTMAPTVTSCQEHILARLGKLMDASAFDEAAAQHQSAVTGGGVHTRKEEVMMDRGP